MRQLHYMPLSVAIVGLVVMAAAGQPRVGFCAEAGKPAPALAQDEHAADKAAIRKATQAFIAAFERGDAKAVADGKLPPVGNTVEVAEATWTKSAK